MVRKVGKDKKLYKKVTCKNCATKLEYLPKDVQFKSYSCMCETEIVSWIVCPQCKAHVTV